MEGLDNLKLVLYQVGRSEKATSTERMRAALALAALDKAVADDGTPLLEDIQIELLCKIINGETG